MSGEQHIERSGQQAMLILADILEPGRGVHRVLRWHELHVVEASATGGDLRATRLSERRRSQKMKARRRLRAGGQ
jgi:hypothetical protein